MPSVSCALRKPSIPEGTNSRPASSASLQALDCGGYLHG